MLSLHEIIVLTDFRTFAGCSTHFDSKIGSLVAKGLIVLGGLGHGPTLTPKGDAMLDLIEATPLPIQSWIDPR